MLRGKWKFFLKESYCRLWSHILVNEAVQMVESSVLKYTAVPVRIAPY